jgi:hypothetical protein
LNVFLTGHKTKERSIPDTVVSDLFNDVYNASHTLQTHTSTGNFTTRTFGEQIVYTRGRRNLYAKSNYCYHKKEAFSYGGVGAAHLAAVSPSGWTVEYNSHHYHACTAKSQVLAAAEIALSGTGATILGGSAQGIINSAFDKLRPDLTTVDIPNFLLELEDISSLFKLWRKRTSLAKNLAGAHLNYKFGWKPNVGDIRDAIGGVLRLKERLSAFKNAVGKTIQSSTQVSLGLPISASGVFNYPSGSHSISWTATCKRSCTAYIAYKPQLPAELKGLLGVLSGLLDTLGFELNPRIIWEAVPFTFVIDWFFGVGTFLQRLKIDTLDLPIALVDGWVQYKETLHIEWDWTRANDGSYTSDPKSDRASFERSFFHRIPIYPDYSSLSGLGWKCPTVNQALLGVSLATVLSKGRSK